MASLDQTLGGAPAAEHDDNDEPEDEEDDDEEEDSDEDEEDPRVDKLRGFMKKHTVEETIALLDEKVGKARGPSFKPAVIGGTMCLNNVSVMAFLLGEALFEVDKGAISEQFKARAGDYLKTFCGEDEARQVSVLVCLERWCVETEAVAKDLHPVLNLCYGKEVVTNDAVFEKWFETPNLSREFGLDEEVTALTRKAAEPFMEWLRTDDGSEEEEIDVAY